MKLLYFGLNFTKYIPEHPMYNNKSALVPTMPITEQALYESMLASPADTFYV